jgi:hypothetical protein
MICAKLVARTASLCVPEYPDGQHPWPIIGHWAGTADMEAINVYREAIKRTFADVYQVLPETIDVSRGDNTITVRCSDHNFTHKIARDDQTTLEFISDTEDPVTITLTDDERRHIEQGPIISAP